MKNICTFLLTLLLNIALYTPDSISKIEYSDRTVKFILNIYDEIRTINSSSDTKEKKFLQIKNIIKRSVDTNRIADFVLTMHLKNMNIVEQNEIKEAYINYMLRKYTKLLINYDGKIDILNQRVLGQNRFSVSTIVQGANQEKVILSYSLIENANGSFLIYDVSIENGISLIITDKDEINSFIEKNGKLGLMQKLKNEY